MSSGINAEESGPIEPPTREIGAALGLSLAFVAATRIPFARVAPVESDELQFVARMDLTWLPAHHTLFQAAGRAIGMVVGGHYRGLVALDMLVSALALVSLWWWLRALVRPGTAAAGTLVVAVSPLFWSLGEMAGNYTMIPLVGAFLFGVAYRGWRDPKPWHPYATAVVLAVGTGYSRGHRDVSVAGVRRDPLAASLATGPGGPGPVPVLNLAWLVPMLHGIGGWTAYRQQSAEFAYTAGYKNSVWHLGLVDAPARYAVKMALGAGLPARPRSAVRAPGMVRLVALPDGKRLAALLILGVAPALGSHLLVHFGVAGYSFHYLPALAALLALGVGRTAPESNLARWEGRAVPRLAGLAGLLAIVFLLYPVDIDRPGWRGDLDLAVGRYTRAGLHADLTGRAPGSWRTSNSVKLSGPVRP